MLPGIMWIVFVMDLSYSAPHRLENHSFENTATAYPESNIYISQTITTANLKPNIYLSQTTTTADQKPNIYISQTITTANQKMILQLWFSKWLMGDRRTVPFVICRNFEQVSMQLSLQWSKCYWVRFMLRPSLISDCKLAILILWSSTS